MPKYQGILMSFTFHGAYRHLLFSFFCFLLVFTEQNHANTLYISDSPNSTKPVVMVIGTRPEAIKMLPVYIALRENGLNALLCSTGQHAQMLTEIYSSFRIHPDADFHIMKPGQDLFYITQQVMLHCKKFFQEVNPGLVLVQGDTTTAMAAAMAAFYLQIPVGHIEAGLRTGNMFAPFPEEMNRKFISMVSSLHFAPTTKASLQLVQEGIPENSIFCTGNTVVDALHFIQNKLRIGELSPSSDIFHAIQKQKMAGKKVFLLTAHRRESIPKGIKTIFEAVKTLIQENKEIAFIFPMHPNPLIRKAAEEVGLLSEDRLIVTAPLAYQDLVYILSHSDGVMTDSGGIQEEAISLGKPLLILRNETDRPEGLSEGKAVLVGTDYSTIISQAHKTLLSVEETPSELSKNVYGDGTASRQIASVVKKFIEKCE